MEIGILILIILGAFIFKKGKSNEESPQKPVPNKDMSWEEMEEYYGITLSRKPEESAKAAPNVTTETSLGESVAVCKPVEVDMKEKPVDSGLYEAETIRTTVHEQRESSRRKIARKPIAEVHTIGPSYHENSKGKSLRAAARQGMVLSMILEPSKGVRMMRRHSR